MPGQFIILLRQGYGGTGVMNLGDRREEIFQDDPDRERFLETLGEVCVKTGWQIHALCLMGNHFQLGRVNSRRTARPGGGSWRRARNFRRSGGAGSSGTTR